MANLPDYTDDTFDSEVKESDTPVMVDFGATWCGPCRALAPIVEDLAKEYEGKLKVGAVDIDKAKGVASRYGIMSVPTLLFFKGGEVVDKVIGLQKKEVLKKKIDAVVTA